MEAMSKSIKLNGAALIVAALGFSASALAAHPGDTMEMPAAKAGVNLTAPEQHSRFGFAVDVLYMEAGNADFNYVTEQHERLVCLEYDNDDPANCTSTSEVEDSWYGHMVSHDYDWGFRASARYDFAGHGRDAALSYTRIHLADTSAVQHSASDSLHATSVWWSNMANAPSQGECEPGSSQCIASGKSRNQYSDIDLVFGQHVDVGARIQLHPFAGVRYASIESRDKALLTSFDSNILGGHGPDTFWPANYVSDFHGFGPRFGSDAAVNLGENVSVRGRVGFAALMGQMEHRGVVAELEEDFELEELSAFHTDSKTLMVPEMDMRLGVSYSQDFADGMLDLELGFEVMNYFGAIDKNIISLTNNIGNPQNFSLQGPYLRVQYDMA
jgi:hypothetical protein